ncbi:MAG: ASPIC/UnbV domain-containing protein [Deltaproteobacteria bacterium]|nr:ASPIC/UnbV domain-containing protein [Deltaproteobacteria bacterium]
MPGLMDQSFSGNEEDTLFMNDGHGHFTDCAAQARVDMRTDGRASAWADLDNDGDLDLVMHQMQSPELRVLRNDLPAGRHWLEVALHGTKSNRMGIGAKVTACAGSSCQVRWIKAGHGYESQGPAVAHFGLGGIEKLDTLKVEWPSGADQELHDVAVDRHVMWTEGEKDVHDARAPKVQLGPPPPPPLTLDALVKAATPGESSDTLLSAAKSGKPVLVNLWSPGCKPCGVEAPVLAARVQQCGEAFARVGLSTEPELAASKTGAAKLGLTWPISTASEAQLRILDDALDGISLPTTLAFDANGRLTGAVVGAATDAALNGLVNCPAHEAAK